MRRARLLAILASISLGCAATSGASYRDLSVPPPPALTAATPTPEAMLLVSELYGDSGAPSAPAAVDAALARCPGCSALHEIAGYQAILRADPHAAFEHFLAAAADMNAIAPELYLWEMTSLAETAREHLSAQAILREIAAQHPRPWIRQMATALLAADLRLFAQREEAEALVKSLGYLDAWTVLGAFDNDQGKGLTTEYPPEAAADGSGEYTGARLPIRFRPLAVSPLDGALPLGDAIAPAASAVAYAETYVHADRAEEVELRLTTTDSVRAWINGRLILSEDKIALDRFDNVAVATTLKPGWNRLLVKSANRSGAWRLAARFTERGGGAVKLFRAATSAPERFPPVPGAASPAISPSTAIDKLTDQNRKRFLLGRIWTSVGHPHRGTWFLDPLLRDAPGNPLVVLYAALAYLDSGESGKALDLLNRGVAKYPAAPAFLIERARFYARRGLWDQAQRDLGAALLKHPDARDARLDLAHVYAARGWTLDAGKVTSDALARWPDASRALAERALCALDLGYLADAEADLEAARALEPGSPPILEQLVALTAREARYDDALALSRELRATSPTSLALMIDEADLLRRAGRTDEAQRLLEAARAQSPDAPRPYERLAALAYAANRRADAVKFTQLASERDPDNVALSERLAFLSPDAPALGERLAASAEDIERAIRSADRVKVHAGSHVVTLLADEVVTVKPDGSSKRIITAVDMAANTQGRDNLIQAKLPSSGRVKVLEAYSIRKDGERQEASSVSGGIIRFRSLDTGSITVTRFVHYAPAPRFLPNEYTMIWSFQGISRQVEDRRVKLILPKGRPLNVKTRGDVEQRTEIVEGSQVRSFVAHKVPPLVPEPSMAPVEDALAMAAVSTVRDWDAYARWETALLADAFPPSPELDALAKKLTLGAATPKEKIDRLWAYVAQEIRYQQEYEDTIAGVKPHAATVVVERGYGDCKDKAVLLIRLARALGIEISFTVLRTTPSGSFLKEIPNQQFNHAIAFVPKQAGIDEPFFVDTTTNGLDLGNLRTDDQGATGLVMNTRTGAYEIVPIPYQPPDLESIKHTVAVDLRDPQRARATDALEVRGGLASSLRVAIRSGEGARKVYQSMSDQIFVGTTLIEGKADHDQDITRPLAIKLDVDVSNAVVADGAGARFAVPLIFPIAQRATLSDRKLPLALPRGVSTFEMEVTLPDGQEASRVPPDLGVEHACFSIQRKTKALGAKVTVSESYRNTCAIILPQDYAGFRAAVQKAVSAAQDHITFGPAQAKSSKKTAQK